MNDYQRDELTALRSPNIQAQICIGKADGKMRNRDKKIHK